jgi:hypothetical protein
MRIPDVREGIFRDEVHMQNVRKNCILLFLSICCGKPSVVTFKKYFHTYIINNSLHFFKQAWTVHDIAIFSYLSAR